MNDRQSSESRNQRKKQPAKMNATAKKNQNNRSADDAGSESEIIPILRPTPFKPLNTFFGFLDFPYEIQKMILSFAAAESDLPRRNYKLWIDPNDLQHCYTIQYRNMLDHKFKPCVKDTKTPASMSSTNGTEIADNNIDVRTTIFLRNIPNRMMPDYLMRIVEGVSPIPKMPISAVLSTSKLALDMMRHFYLGLLADNHGDYRLIVNLDVATFEIALPHRQVPNPRHFQDEIQRRKAIVFPGSAESPFRPQDWAGACHASS